MLENKSSLALVPKAKAMAARRLTKDDYAELERKRSVLEVTAALQNHPYFADSLKGLSPMNLHRAQIEEALRKDIFYKYEALMRYTFEKDSFGTCFLMRCEITELLAKLRLLSMGFRHHYIIQLPGFLASKTSFSLLKLAKAETVEECVPVVAGTPYAKVLASVMPPKGKRPDYLLCEHAFWNYYYNTVLRQIDRSISGQTREDTKRLFLQQAEIYNLDLLYRAKAFYNTQLPPQKIRSLLLDATYVLTPKKLSEMADARNLTEFLRLYNDSRARAVYGERTEELDKPSDIEAGKALYRAAERLLHFSCTPQTVLAAVLCLADIQRSNIINIIEGVRYGLPAAQINAFLKY